MNKNFIYGGLIMSYDSPIHSLDKFPLLPYD